MEPCGHCQQPLLPFGEEWEGLLQHQVLEQTPVVGWSYSTREVRVCEGCLRKMVSATPAPKVGYPIYMGEV